ncbi:glycosyltransferase 87 family protein [Nonomuraea monospora]|uniref:Glycosyltransferase 87 family protein n=1 Tax=Nonomuraea monospora TaxID=568818 RepID=A0ABN3CY17_9ACTN
MPRTTLAWTAAVLLTAAALCPLLLHWLTNPDDQRLVDLAVYREGGSSFLLGRPIYDHLTPAPQLLPFTYPPIAAMLAAPLAALSWTAAQWAWTGGIVATLAAVTTLAFGPLTIQTGRLRPYLLAAAVIASAYLIPVQYQVRFGQVGLFLTLLCLLDCTVKAPWWPRGVLIGLATAIKLVPGLFIIYLWITGRQRAATAAAITTITLTALPFALIPQDAAAFWFRALLAPDRAGAANATTNQSLRGMLLRLYLDSGVTTALWLVTAATVGALGLIAARALSRDGQEIAAVSVTGLLTALLSPIGWMHHFTWIILTIAAALGRDSGPGRFLRAGLIWLAFTIPIPYLGVAVWAGHPTDAWAVISGKILQDAFGLIVVGLVAAAWWQARTVEQPIADPQQGPDS